MEKSKLAPINTEQKRMLVEYLQKYPNVAKQKFSSDFSYKTAQKHWEKLTEMLNSVPGGPKKTWLQWRKTWTDIKKNTKNKAVVVQRYMQVTGGGPVVPKEKEVTDLEKDILEIIGNVVQRGHENITETPVEFHFDNDENINISNIEVMESGTTDEPPSNSTEMDGYKSIYSEFPISSTFKNAENLNSKKLPETPSARVKPKKFVMSGKRLSATRRLENSQKASADMLEAMQSRTSSMENYYKRKCEHFQHIKNYHEKKIKLQEKNYEVLKEILREVKELQNLRTDKTENGKE